MKARQNVIAEAATTFTTQCQRKQAAPTAVDSVLPNVAADLTKVEPFVQKTPVPRGMLKSFTASVIERVLTKGVPLTSVAPILLPSELEYVTLVLDEVYQWASEQGFFVCATEKAAS